MLTARESLPLAESSLQGAGCEVHSGVGPAKEQETLEVAGDGGCTRYVQESGRCFP